LKVLYTSSDFVFWHINIEATYETESSTADNCTAVAHLKRNLGTHKQQPSFVGTETVASPDNYNKRNNSFEQLRIETQRNVRVKRNANPARPVLHALNNNE
jgi:hypothetical protein